MYDDIAIHPAAEQSHAQTVNGIRSAEIDNSPADRILPRGVRLIIHPSIKLSVRKRTPRPYRHRVASHGPVSRIAVGIIAIHFERFAHIQAFEFGGAGKRHVVDFILVFAYVRPRTVGKFCSSSQRKIRGKARRRNRSRIEIFFPTRKRTVRRVIDLCVLIRNAQSDIL